VRRERHLCGILVLLGIVGISRPGLAATGNCSPLPQVASDIRLIVPSNSDVASSPTQVVVAVKPRDQDITASEVFSAVAVVGSERLSLWLTVPVAMPEVPPGVQERLRDGERAWSFRITGAPRQATVTVFTTHFVYGATDDTPSILCRRSAKVKIGAFTTR
jgi:hypothetical protein